jgi:hypothetical protein
MEICAEHYAAGHYCADFLTELQQFVTRPNSTLLEQVWKAELMLPQQIRTGLLPFAWIAWLSQSLA